MHPVDTLKIRLIASESAAGGAESAAAAAAPPVDNVSAQRARKPPLSPLAQLLDLYEGIVGNLVKEGPSSALYLGVYEAAKNRLSAPGSPLALILSARPSSIAIIGLHRSTISARVP